MWSTMIECTVCGSHKKIEGTTDWPVTYQIFPDRPPTVHNACRECRAKILEHNNIVERGMHEKPVISEVATRISNDSALLAELVQISRQTLAMQGQILQLLMMQAQQPQQGYAPPQHWNIPPTQFGAGQRYDMNPYAAAQRGVIGDFAPPPAVPERMPTPEDSVKAGVLAELRRMGLAV